ncbi:ankyrin repeat containing protein [Colletotrichum asianum]|uniref:Ankyrin repeat containing protein n=1 Tax=Colletotrichum asianum TaxID=702518 RepID=A0A8H3ZP98_9PEZI|nr:ankyrin repeat containing protein [Colletotrichum asianum]
MPPSKRLHYDNPEWTRRKAAIEEMYVFDRLSQKKIRDQLEEDGFRVTKSELEAQLRFWSIRKNVSADAWRYTDHMLLKREQQSKASVVYYNGRKVLRNTLKKERSRYQPDTLTKYMKAVSPQAPEGVELLIRTPTPAPMQSAWAHTLPWLQLQNKGLSSA